MMNVLHGLGFEQAHFELPAVAVPQYREGVFGEWKVHKKNAPMIRGYFNGIQVPENDNYILLNTEQGTVWMSVTPMELESHAYHVQWAKGKTVMVGLGMGMYLYNICRKPEVTEVIVIEKEEAVIQAFYQFSGCESWEGWNKVKIMHGDALCASEEVKEQAHGADYLYADIWPSMGAMEAMDDMKIICDEMAPKAAGWWCQELDYHSIAEKGEVGYDTSEIEQVIREGWNIPVVASQVEDYDRLFKAAAFNLIMM